nr:ABC transporter substrate-binding protein [Paracoccaceae bacterium]
AGRREACGVGEPWGSVAGETGAGVLLLPTAAIWASAPEKVLATRAGWAEAEPRMAGRLLRALWRAGRWLGEAGNHMVASEMLARSGRLAVAPELIERALAGRMVIAPDGAERVTPGLIRFGGDAAGFPWRSQAAWIGAALARRHGLAVEAASAAAAAVFRPDLYRLHLRAAGAELPSASAKLEGALNAPTAVASERGQLILPADRFFDSRIFDPSLPAR